MIRIVFLGEFDCGKSTLIGRLLFDTGSISEESREEFLKITREQNKELEFAYLLDSFEEERRDELTIDTTQAFLKTQSEEYLLIDVPGHKQLLKNMLTGTSCADFAILVCDINKLLEEQTKRHAYLLKFLGINGFILAINKMDKVNFSKEDFDKANIFISGFLKQIDFNPKEIIPISAKTGENIIEKSVTMPWYKGPSLLEAMSNLRIDRSKFTYLRFPIQDIYQKGRKKVIVGIVLFGSIKQGDRVKIVPGGLGAKVKKIVVFGKNKLRANHGESIGIVLDIKDELRRGQLIYEGIIPRVTNQFWAKIFCIQNIDEIDKMSFKCNTQDVPCRIIKIKEVINTTTMEMMPTSFSLEQTNAAEVLIETSKLVSIDKLKEITSLNRFILYHKEKEVLAIGVVQ